MRIIDMDDTQGYYSHGEEVRGLHMIMINVETKSNGHRGRVEPIEIIETLKILQK
jgi:hypothetical protein